MFNIISIIHWLVILADVYLSLVINMFTVTVVM